MGIRVVSLDMACTVFWEPGCVLGWERETLKRAVRAMYDRLVELGYNIQFNKLYELLLKTFREQSRIMPGREVWHLYRIYKVLSELGISPTPKLTMELYESYINGVVKGFTLPEEHRHVIEKLREMGYIIVLATDTGSHDIPYRILVETKSIDLFDAIISSHLVGYTKADPRFYRVMSEILGVPTNEIVHVGDNVERDYSSALKAGVHAILYKPMGCSEDDPKPCISSLTELLKILRS